MRDGTTPEFSDLTPEERERYLLIASQMSKFARDHAIPISYGPHLTRVTIPDGNALVTAVLPESLGKVESASGSVVNLHAGYFLVTADHVVEDYENRVQNGEALNWQVGKLRSFDPLTRVAWRGSCKRPAKDIVFLRMSEAEAREACADRTNIISSFTIWPTLAPQVGETILLAGFPTVLRNIANGVIEAGSLSALFQVTTSIGDGTFKCRYKYAEVFSFDGKPLPFENLRVNLGGISGGPVFAVRNISYPFVGVVSQRSGAFNEVDTIVIEAVEGVPSSF